MKMGSRITVKPSSMIITMKRICHPCQLCHRHRLKTGQQDDEADASAEAELTIVQPAHEENLWGTGGKVTAQVNEIAVALMEVNQVQCIIDGKKQPPADGLTQVFDGIFRGEHTLKARVINKYNKKVIKESKTITFYMHQNSKK